MEFNQTIDVIDRILKAIGSDISIHKYDGVIVKKLESSNTLDSNRTTNQTHIAITGAQMDMFPYVRANGYFDVEYSEQDAGLKKYFVAQIPVYLHAENINYLSDSMILGNAEELVHVSIVRSRRNNATDQIQMSMTNMDSARFVEYRKNIHAGSYMVLLKREKELIYDMYAVKKDDVAVAEDDLSALNNIFSKSATNTVVKLDEILVDDLKEKSELTPEWFKEKAIEFPTLDQEAEDFRQEFLEKFSVEKLKDLSDTELLETIFLNSKNKTNLCYVLEFDSDCRFIYGSIKSGTAYKYGLHYSQKNSSWATGTGRNPQLLSEEEAIELGTKIRDNLIAGAEIISSVGDVSTIGDYEELYDELYQATDGFINRVWFLKYYAMLFPMMFPPNYSTAAQNTIIEKLNLEASDNTLVRMGVIREFVDKCELSGVVFSRIFWKYCNNKDDDKDIIEDEEKEVEELKTCLEIEREPRIVKIHPLNLIIYGAPGTGKTYSTAEYAQAIIQGITLKEFQENNKDRKAVMKAYNELVKSGQVVFTTFHQSYGYEEFIQGLRPDTTSEKMSFKTVDGVFKRIADKALNDQENNYVIIIDEINRANISKVFGELITLIEDDKRWGELNQTSATLQSGDPFAVPNNLYIVGTMNSADKSISLIDAALRRRFEFIEQKPNAALVNDTKMRAVLTKLNEQLADQLDSSDLLIGHSYFMGKTIDELPTVLNNSIIPLLYEYFYDNKKKVMGVLNGAIEPQVDFVVEDDKLGRIFIERQSKNS